MYKNGLSSYQIKKEKLKKIKKILWDLKTNKYKESIERPDVGHILQTIWEIVRSE